MYCKQCGEQLNDKQAICLECGFKVGDGEAYCAKCGHNLIPDSINCPNCGEPVAPHAGEYLNGKSKKLMAVLALFLGNFGVHHFVLGEIKKGILKIFLTFCCCISTVFSVVDFIKILSDSYVVDQDKIF